MLTRTNCSLAGPSSEPELPRPSSCTPRSLSLGTSLGRVNPVLDDHERTPRRVLAIEPWLSALDQDRPPDRGPPVAVLLQRGPTKESTVAEHYRHSNYDRSTFQRVAVRCSACVAELTSMGSRPPAAADVAGFGRLTHLPAGPIPYAARGLAAVLARAGPGGRCAAYRRFGLLQGRGRSRRSCVAGDIGAIRWAAFSRVTGFWGLRLAGSSRWHRLCHSCRNTCSVTLAHHRRGSIASDLGVRGRQRF